MDMDDVKFPIWLFVYSSADSFASCCDCRLAKYKVLKLGFTDLCYIVPSYRSSDIRMGAVNIA